MKTVSGVLSLVFAFLVLLVQPALARRAENGHAPSEPVVYPVPIHWPGIVLGAQLNGHTELPPNASPLYAAARFTLENSLFIIPTNQPRPFPTNWPPLRPPGVITNLPPIVISNVPPAVRTNFPPIVISNRPPILITNLPRPILPSNGLPIVIINPLPVFPSNAPVVLEPVPLVPSDPLAGDGESSGGVVVRTLAAVSPALADSLPAQPGPGQGPFPPEPPAETMIYLQGYVVFPPSVMTNALGILPGTVSLEDETGNPISNLVAFGHSPLGIYTSNLDEQSAFPVGGGFVLTSEQKADLLAGRWFVRVQAVTVSGEDYPAGAIRGRILPVDSDGDGVPDYLDFCPGTESGATVDTNGCSVAQHCPCLASWQNHGDYINCVQTTASSFLQQGLISAAERAALVREAAKSDAGRRLTPAAPHSGISGQSMLYLGGAYGSVPYPTSFKVLSQSGSLLTEGRTDLQGQFQVNLKPGVYTLVPWLQPPPNSEPGGGAIVFYPLAEPVTVAVPFQQFTNVVISYSFGIW